ncbi:ABC transporter ATP-binding protein [bacterium]|nr:ABC transporter ATP-binding protein [bacterium]
MTESIDARFVKLFPSGFHLNCEFSIPIQGFSFSVLFGPSGSGKTTILRILAGLDRPDEGVISFCGEKWFDSNQGLHRSPQSRGIGIVFQDYALFPHLSVEQNISFGLKGISGRERSARVNEILSMLRLDPMRSRFPHKLSGGEQQRVALARTLVRRPRLLLLDEPLSALDQPTRAEIRHELRGLLQALDVPTILVTHDRVETIALAERVIVLSGGSVQQIGDVQQVFNHPANEIVAQIVGVETVLPGVIREIEEGIAVVDVGTVSLRAAVRDSLPNHVTVCIRAEEVLIEKGAQGATSARNRFQAVVRSIIAEGPVYRIVVDGGFELTALITRHAREEMALQEGDTVLVVLKAHGIHLVPRE